MSKEDKLFNFTFGLQGWAQMELQRQGVHDLPTTMVAVDCLVDYKMGDVILTMQKPKSTRVVRRLRPNKTSKKLGWKKQNMKGVVMTKPVEKTTKFVQQTTEWQDVIAHTNPKTTPKEKNS
ncbi:hypothetical protein CK203_042070 [Vitis vinifera]|uniref:Uncharacterized protein n=1 Tax=Vitis vinifera TaxID=29760 RepID=A0A438HHS7_VITVI|nr:hypothetical protein CK203_042070 [Vitis vinifera]